MDRVGIYGGMFVAVLIVTAGFVLTSTDMSPTGFVVGSSNEIYSEENQKWFWFWGETGELLNTGSIETSSVGVSISYIYGKSGYSFSGGAEDNSIIKTYVNDILVDTFSYGRSGLTDCPTNDICWSIYPRVIYAPVSGNPTVKIVASTGDGGIGIREFKVQKDVILDETNVVHSGGTGYHHTGTFLNLDKTKMDAGNIKISYKRMRVDTSLSNTSKGYIYTYVNGDSAHTDEVIEYSGNAGDFSKYGSESFILGVPDNPTIKFIFQSHTWGMSMKDIVIEYVPKRPKMVLSSYQSADAEVGNIIPVFACWESYGGGITEKGNFFDGTSWVEAPVNSSGCNSGILTSSESGEIAWELVGNSWFAYSGNIPTNCISDPGKVSGANIRCASSVSGTVNFLISNPPFIEHTGIVSSIIGEDILIEANITDSETFVTSASLSYRRVGKIAYSTQPMLENNDVYIGIIPGLSVTEDVEYFIEALDSDGNLRRHPRFANYIVSANVRPTTTTTSMNNITTTTTDNRTTTTTYNCPVYSAVECLDGNIVSGEIDVNGCEGPSTCVTSTTVLGTTTTRNACGNSICNEWEDKTSCSVDCGFDVVTTSTLVSTTTTNSGPVLGIFDFVEALITAILSIFGI